MTAAVLAVIVLVVGRAGAVLAEVLVARRRVRRLVPRARSTRELEAIRQRNVALLPQVRRFRRRPSVEHELPAVLDAVGRSLRSGSTVVAAVDDARAAATGPLAGELARLAAQARVHGAVPALESWARERSDPGVRLAVAALVLGAHSGGAPARAVDGVAASLRARLAVATEVRALSSQARLSAAVIAVAPLAFAILASATDAGVARVLLGTGLGAALLLGGLVLDAVGALWMARICRPRRPAPVDDELPELVDLLTVAVGAGMTVRLAVEAVAARGTGVLGAELRHVVAQCARGHLLADALADLPARAGESLRPLAAALADADRYGVPLLPALERLAAEARDHRRRQAEERARRVPVLLLFPLVFCILPAFGLLTVAPLLAGALDALAA